MKKLIKKLTAVLLSLSFIITSFSLASYYDFNLFSWIKASAEEFYYEPPFEFTVEDGEAIITGYDWTESIYEIPQKIAGYPVVGIADYVTCGGVYEYTDLIIPDGFKYIGDGAFNACLITSITLPESLEYIGAEAFSSCEELTEIVIPSGVTSINDETFIYCYNLDSVTILGDVTYIGEDAFRGCDSLSTIYFAGTEEEWNAIEICSGNEILDYISVCYESAGPIIKEYNGLEFEIKNNQASVIFYGWGNVSGNVVIPSEIEGYTVTSIEDYAFSFSDITSVTIPDSVTKIGIGAFSNCIKLEEIVISKGVTEIADSVFAGCTNLKRVSIPEGVLSIASNAFEKTYLLTEITLPESLLEINSYAFVGSGLKSVFIPDNVEYISDSAFAYCRDLERFTVSNNRNFEIVNGALCSLSTVLFLPNKSNVKEYSVSGYYKIGDYAFFDCDNLEYIYIDSGVIILSSYSFAFCDNLKGIIVDKNNSCYLSDENGVLFERLDDFLMDDILLIKSWPVKSPSENIVIPFGYLVADEVAFSGEYNKKFIITEEFSELMQMLIEYSGMDYWDMIDSFYCLFVNSSFTEFVVSDSDVLFSTEDGALYDKNKSVLLKYPIGSNKKYFEIAETAIPIMAAFAAASEDIYYGEENYVMPSNLTVHVSPKIINEILDESTFDDIRWGLLGTKIICAEVSAEVAANANAIISENICEANGYSKEFVEKMRFKVVSCSEVENLSKTGSCGDDLIWLFDDITGELSILGKGEMWDFKDDSVPWSPYIDSIKLLVIHEGVKSIGSGAFAEHTELLSVTMPTALEEIGDAAFAYCTGLTSVLIPDNVRNIGLGAFGYCRNLERVYLACYKITEIPDCAFMCCEKLYFIDIPVNVKIIGESSFAYCSNLKKITLPGRSIIEDNAFNNCSNLAIIDLAYADKIGSNTFYNCDNLASIEIPYTVSNIGENAFSNCDNLAVVNMNGKVSELKDGTFSACPKLRRLEIPSTVSNISLTAFDVTEELTVVCSKDSYAHKFCVDNKISYTFSSMANSDYVDSALYNGHTYAIFADELSWNDAKAVCESMGGHLAVVTSAEEQTVITNLASGLAGYGYKGYWLGASKTAEDGTWNWVTGEPFNYEYFGSGEPNNEYGGENCLEQFSETSKWNDESGTSKLRGFICEFEDLRKPVAVSCTEDSIYVLYNDSLSWTEAEAFCESIGGHLVTITSPEEQQTVETLVALQNKKLYWIGLSDSETEGEWKWVTGEEVTYTNWGGNEPSGSSTSDQDYGQIFSSYKSDIKPQGTWNDDFNNGNTESAEKYYRLANVGFVCEIPRKNLIPANAGYYGNSYYEVYNYGYSWNDAKLISENMGGHLAVITDAEEYEFIKSLLPNENVKEGYRLGASDSQIEGVWLNVTGENFSFSDWGSGEPNDGTNYDEDYLEYYLKVSAQNDSRNAAPQRGFVVEYDLPVSDLCLYETDYTAIDAYEVPEGMPLDVPTAAKTGYSVEWYDDKELTVPWDFEKTVGRNETITLYAKWIPNERTVVFNSNGGECKIAKKNVLYCKPYSSLPIPERLGYTFDGWYTEAVGGEKITRDTLMIQPTDHEIYAHWIPDDVNVSFDLNGGFFNGTEIPDIVVSVGDEYGDLPIPQKTSCNFDGWYLSDGTTKIASDSIVQIASNHTLVAKWTESQISSVAIGSLPNKTEYILGDSLDTDGLTLIVTFDNGEVFEVSEGFICDFADFETPGTYTVVVNYEGFETEFTVNVSKGAPVSISINSLPSKTNYVVGESFEETGLTLIAKYSDGLQEIISSGFECSVSDFSKAGTHKVTVTYENCQASFNVTVTNGNPIGLSIQTLPQKLQYYIGESLDTTGLVLKVEYPNSVYKTINQGFKTACNLNSIGTKTVNVTYTENGVSVVTSYTVEVIPEPEYPLVAAQNVAVSSGETVSIPVNISNNNGFMGFALILEYDEDVFIPVSTTKGAMLADGTFNDSIGGTMPDGKLKVVYCGTNNVCGDGTLFNVDFAVNEKASSGNHTIKISYIQQDTFNEYYEDVILSCADSRIDIINPAEQNASAKLYIEPMQVNAGDEIVVPVYFEVYRGELGFSEISISYNSEMFSFNGGDCCFEHLLELKESDDENGKIVISNSGFSFGEGIQGVICNVRFKVKDYVEGTETISLSCHDAYSYDDPTEVFCQNGEITIVNPHANEPAIIYTDDYVAIKDGYVDVPVYINNNHGIMGFGMNVIYDNSVIEAVSVTKNSLLSSGSFDNNMGKVSGNIKIIWNNTEDIFDNGLLYTVRFRLLDESVTEIPLSVTYSQPDTYNENWEDVPLNIVVNSIPVRKEFTAQFIADGVVVSTQKFTSETVSLEEPAIPQKAGYIARWGRYELKEEDIVIYAKYDSPSALMLTKQTMNVDDFVRLLPSCNFGTTRKVWTSSDTSVAVVDNRGYVVAVGEGECSIKVTCYGVDSLGNEISASATTKIVVNEKSDAKTLKEKFREAFDEFFEVKLHDFVENLRWIIISVLKFIY